MPNFTLFRTWRGKNVPSADTKNEAGGAAYSLTPKQALAQYAATGTFSRTYYADARDQLDGVLKHAAEVEPRYLAQLAVWTREYGYMKDMPAALLAVLSGHDPALFRQVFGRVIDNVRMLRTFVQIMRSGATGRKSLGTAPKTVIREWLRDRSDNALFRASVGNTPSLADIIKMVHPKATEERANLYGYLLGKEHNAELLPPLVRQYEAFKAGDIAEIPDVPFEMLTARPLTTEQWAAIARNARWQWTRMNLNTLSRHKVWEVDGLTRVVTERLRDPAEVRGARAFPYQLLAAYLNAGDDVPNEVREALQDAMEVAIENVPAIDGQVFVCPDVSGSMSMAITGRRKGATSKMTAVHVAALVSAALLRRNPTARVLPFDTDVVNIRLNPRDSVMTNATKLAHNGGGTAVSAPLKKLNDERAKGELVVFVSDNQSWYDAGSTGTELAQEWARFKTRNPRARMVCIDVQPYATVQAKDTPDVLNIGGFSDHVFELLAQFAGGEFDAGHWVGKIEAIEI